MTETAGCAIVTALRVKKHTRLATAEIMMPAAEREEAIIHHHCTLVHGVRAMGRPRHRHHFWKSLSSYLINGVCPTLFRGW